MSRVYIPLILFVLLILEGVSIRFLPPQIAAGDLLFIPHWILLFLILVCIFYDKPRTYHAVIYALIFGFLIDMIYTGLLGAYMFTYGFAMYLTHILKRAFHGNFYVSLLLAAIGTALSDIVIYVIYSVIGFTDLYWTEYASVRLLPTIIINLIFLVIIYPMFVKRFIRWSDEQDWSS